MTLTVVRSEDDYRISANGKPLCTAPNHAAAWLVLFSVAMTEIGTTLASSGSRARELLANADVAANVSTNEVQDGRSDD